MTIKYKYLRNLIKYLFVYFTVFIEIEYQNFLYGEAFKWYQWTFFR
jgi:hypothetical protein